jgi:hypothetical protein
MHVIQPTKVRSYARISSVVTLLVAPLTALSYFATKDGAESYDVASTKFWAHPARELLDPLLSFGSVDRVYATYVLVLAVMLPALPLAAWTVRRARAPFARIGERRASWVVAAAWSLCSAGLLIAGLALQVKPSDTAGNSVVNLAFMIGVFPGLVIGVLGSLVLGIMLLRTDFAPRGSAVVIMLALPVWFVGSVVLGFNSLGIVPQLLAWSFAVAAVVERSDSQVSPTIA